MVVLLGEWLNLPLNSRESVGSWTSIIIIRTSAAIHYSTGAISEFFNQANVKDFIEATWEPGITFLATKFDPGSTYRTCDEVSGVRQERDPIERVRKLILAHDIATEKELKDIEKEKTKEVDDAIAQAKESPMPDPSDLYTNVYVKGYGVEMARCRIWKK